MNRFTRAVMVLSIMVQLSACGGSGNFGDGKDNNLSRLPSHISSAALSSKPAPILGVIPAAWLSEHPTGIASSVPSLRIQTQNSAPIQTKETYLQATYELHDETGVISGNTDIRGRGNSTWYWVKKPYRLRLANATELLGMPANRHWALLANYAAETAEMLRWQREGFEWMDAQLNQ